jgi:predicted dehydrogenase
VIGAGYAGEGHARALQHWGVTVAAICARQPDVVHAVAARLGVPDASTDWRATLERVRPEIVALATPASLRAEVIEQAAALGSHLYCDKPLATTAPEARRLFEVVRQAGVKHAYAATYRYDPRVAWLAELVQSGAIGAVREVVLTNRLDPFPPHSPWSWASVLAHGGGWLNNQLPHWLGVLTTVLGAEPARVAGRAWPTRLRAPVVPGIHDFREWRARVRELSRADVAGLEWRPCDADGACSVLVDFAAPHGTVPFTCLTGPGVGVAEETDGLRLYGDDATLVASGPPASVQFTIARVAAGQEPEPLPVPSRLLEHLPPVGTGTMQLWAALARDFVADVRGEPHTPYLTFRDGWRYQEAIDAIRSGAGWQTLPE